VNPIDTDTAAAVLVFTDLDGTLLDHDTYRFDAAQPALDALHERRIPLILSTSKTLAEVVLISGRLGNSAPMIVENGGALCFPNGHPAIPSTHSLERLNGFTVMRLSPPYALIRAFIERQRAASGFALRGFGDMDADAVAAATGLPYAEAGLARQRLCSEPFEWQDSASRLRQFDAAAEQAGLRITRGGRFHHLMGDTSKARAMLLVRNLYRDNWGTDPGVIALGDSENDREMLQAADIAVIVRRPDGTHLECAGRQRTLFTAAPGPRGWNTAMLQLLPDIDRRPNHA
jgi:mannosyl-3-phosphoglycerate phosphatase